MAVYRILVKKRIQLRPFSAYDEWVNSYTVVSDVPYTREELLFVADTIAPRFVVFEQRFHIEEVELYETHTTPILDPPQPRPHAQRSIDVPGLRPIAHQASAGGALVLWLGFEPLRNDWGKKDYRYAVAKDDYEPDTSGYRLTASALQQLQARLTTAKAHLSTLLRPIRTHYPWP